MRLPSPRMTLPFSERVMAASLVSAAARRAASSNDCRLVQRDDLRLVGEQDVDGVADQADELGAVPVDAERIGQAERDLPAGLGRNRRRLAERGLRFRPVEQIAFQVDDARRADQLGIDLAAAELRAARPGRCSWCAGRPASPGSGSSAVGSLPSAAAGVVKVTPAARMSCANTVAELVLRDLADEAGLAAERGDAGHGVGDRSARDLHAPAPWPS